MNPIAVIAPGDVSDVKRARRRLSPAARLLGCIGAVLVGVVVLAAIFAPWIAQHDPRVASGLPYQRPSSEHLLGTNDIGQDLFAQLLYGARVSLAVAVVSAVVAVSVGMTVAVVAGYRGGRIEAFLMGLVDLTLSFPFLVLVVVTSTFLGRSISATVIVTTIVLWARPARVFRSQVLKISEFGHVAVARAMGGGLRRILLTHIARRLVPLAAAQTVRAANIAVMIEASLAFLGLGDIDRISWGSTLYFANTHSAVLTDAWLWWIVPPGLALTTAMVGLAFVAYAVEEWADPRLARGTRPRRRRAQSKVVPLIEMRSGEPGTANLTLTGLAVRYRSPDGDVPAVRDIDLQVPTGRIVGLVGESGSGKSTVAVALVGLHRPPARVDSGEMTIGAQTLNLARRATVEPLRGQAIGFVPQNAMTALNPSYRVLRQVIEAAEVSDLADPAGRASELLDLVGIPKNRRRAYPNELSGGMRQRVVIAAALVNRPRLLIADEPTSGLDVGTQMSILRLISDLRDRFGLGVLLISHDLPMLSRVADDLIVMYAGAVVERGPAMELVTHPTHPYTKGLLQSFPRLRGPRDRLTGIPGDPPNLRSLPVGCSFQARCGSVENRCRLTEPTLLTINASRSVACFVAHDVTAPDASVESNASAEPNSSVEPHSRRR